MALCFECRMAILPTGLVIVNCVFSLRVYIIFLLELGLRIIRITSEYTISYLYPLKWSVVLKDSTIFCLLYRGGDED